MDREYERRLLRQQNGPVSSPASPLSPRRQLAHAAVQSPSKDRNGDRFIPTRAGANWDVNFALIQPRRQLAHAAVQSPSKDRNGDRFIPTRAGANWDVNFALIQENNKASQ
ncbi:Fizzy-related [Chionoecetes opilio]|uniref:Fizzy-related n=1 Tax=Chionoecetes opilio TaxID=41210 RepID=A0A8J4YKL3_CHIOP|nr:Fizzy-related [Chionoecetes opilio]